MKTLYLVRHAKAVKAKEGEPDSDRPLEKSGKKNAKYLARKFKKEGVALDLILSSSAKRAQETAQTFAKELAYPIEKIVLQEELYQPIAASAHLELIKKLDNKHNSIMVFGHIPNSEDFASYLLKDIQVSIPQCGVVCIEFNKQSWSTLTKGSGTLKFIDFPFNESKKSEAYKTAQKDLELQLTNQLQHTLKGIDALTASKFDKYIKGSSTKLARDFIKEIRSYKLAGAEAIGFLKKAESVKSKKQTTKSKQPKTKVESKSQPILAKSKSKPAAKSVKSKPTASSKKGSAANVKKRSATKRKAAPAGKGETKK